MWRNVDQVLQGVQETVKKPPRDAFGLLPPPRGAEPWGGSAAKKTALAGGIASRWGLTVFHRRRNQVAFVAMDVVLKRLQVLRFDINLGL